MFFENFNALCRERGMSPSGVCREIGISTTNISKWRAGSIPFDSTVRRIAAYFGVAPEQLTGEGAAGGRADAELAELLEELRDNPEKRMLFQLLDGATVEEVRQAVAIIEALRKTKREE